MFAFYRYRPDLDDFVCYVGFHHGGKTNFKSSTLSSDVERYWNRLGKLPTKVIGNLEYKELDTNVGKIPVPPETSLADFTTLYYQKEISYNKSRTTRFKVDILCGFDLKLKSEILGTSFVKFLI